MMLKCNKCGKALQLKDGTIMSGLRLSYSEASGENKKMIKLARGLWGKYLPKGETNIEYNFCYECWLDSLMGVK